VSTGSSVSTSTTTTTQSTGSANKAGVTTVAAKGGKLPKVLEFYATWCTPCKKLKPFVDEAAKKYKGKIEVEDINIDDPKNQLICDQYKVKAVPTVVFLQPDGKVYHQFVGFKKREEVLNQFDNLLRASEAGK
jgi:thioredoxin 1